MYSDNEGSYLLKGVAFFVFGRWKADVLLILYAVYCCVVVLHITGLHKGG